MDLPDIRFVLVEPSHPGNIGAAARAMKNMGLSELVLVRPKTSPHSEAIARASGADDMARARSRLSGARGARCGIAFGQGVRPFPGGGPLRSRAHGVDQRRSR